MVKTDSDHLKGLKMQVPHADTDVWCRRSYMASGPHYLKDHLAISSTHFQPSFNTEHSDYFVICFYIWLFFVSQSKCKVFLSRDQ